MCCYPWWWLSACGNGGGRRGARPRGGAARGRRGFRQELVAEPDAEPEVRRDFAVVLKEVFIPFGSHLVSIEHGNKEKKHSMGETRKLLAHDVEYASI